MDIPVLNTQRHRLSASIPWHWLVPLSMAKRTQELLILHVMYVCPWLRWELPEMSVTNTLIASQGYAGNETSTYLTAYSAASPSLGTKAAFDTHFETVDSIEYSQKL